MSETTPPAAPVVLHKGQYTVYQTPDDGIHIAYRKEGAPEDEHLEIPGHILKLAEMASSGKISPMALLSKMRKGGQ
jgi:hypothetical protein